jgi:hypothetical protein
MTAEELWACRVCRSINSRRANRCYSCHTPRDAAEVKPADMPTVGEMPPVVHTATYRSTEMRAVMVSLAGAAFIIATLAAAFLIWQVASLRADGKVRPAEELLAAYGPYLVVLPVLGVVALLAYAAWISRVVENLPALGLGFSRVSGTMAFLEPLIPGFNLFALPARLGEMLHKLQDKGGGMAQLGLASILVIVPPVVSVIVLRFTAPRSFDMTTFRVAFDGFTNEFIRIGGFVTLLTATFVSVGLLIGLSLIWRVERLARTHAEAQQSQPAPTRTRS